MTHLKILSQHQKWRRGKLDVMPCTPKELGEAIDACLREIRSSRKELADLKRRLHIFENDLAKRSELK